MAPSKQARKNKQQARSASKGKAPVKKQAKKTHGTLLTILIALIGIHGLLGIYLVASNIKQVYISQRPWALALLIAVAIANLVAAIGIWYWKQWGIYVYIFATVAVASMTIVLTASVWASLYQFIPVAILGYVITLQNKQKLFE